MVAVASMAQALVGALVLALARVALAVVAMLVALHRDDTRSGSPWWALVAAVAVVALLPL